MGSGYQNFRARAAWTHLAEILASDGLILDVRQNDGGSGVMAYEILGYLNDKDFETRPWKSRQYIATLRVWGQPGVWWEPKPAVWKAMGGTAIRSRWRCSSAPVALYNPADDEDIGKGTHGQASRMDAA